MREMELWRDKIQLRIRDRIQNSASFSVIFQAISGPFIPHFFFLDGTV